MRFSARAGGLPRSAVGPAAIVIRSEREIEMMARAGAIVASVLEAVRPVVVPGRTARELDAEIERRIRRAGAVPSFKGYQGFPAASCVSVNDQVVHGIPDGYRFQPGDLVSVDVGATLGGYVGDGAYTFGLEPLSPERQRLLAVTQKALNEGIASAQPGNRIGDISAAVQRRVEGAGFSVVRAYCGHGVGTTIHEEPQVPNYGEPGRGPRLRPGMVIAIEPMVNLGVYEVTVDANGWTVRTADGGPSAHFEHTVAITASGPRILTVADSAGT